MKGYLQQTLLRAGRWQEWPRSTCLGLGGLWLVFWFCLFSIFPCSPSCVCHLQILSPQLLPSSYSPSRGIPSFSPTSPSSTRALEFSPGLGSKVVFEAVSPFVFKPSRLSDLGLLLIVGFLVFCLLLLLKDHLEFKSNG